MKFNATNMLLYLIMYCMFICGFYIEGVNFFTRPSLGTSFHPLEG